MSNPEVKIRLSLDGAGQVQTGVQGAAASLDKLGQAGAKAGQQAQISGQQVAQVSAQLQDLFIQIQGGQAPLTALLQQGSQLSTVFGGVGNAARAVSGTVAAMINPFTVAAAAIGTFAAGAYLGSQELSNYRKTLILTGNAAGVTAEQLNDMAGALGRLGGTTQARAGEALVQLAAYGRVGSENLQRFTAAAVQMEKVGGRAIEDTTKIYADLAKAPLEAALKQNEATNFLTRAQYEQIKSLEALGAKTEAARIAQEAFYASDAGKAQQQAQNLGILEQAWSELSTAIGRTWDATKNIGRDDSLAELERKLANARLAANDAGPAGLIALYYANNVKSLQEQVDKLREVESGERAAAQAAKERADQVRAAAEFDKLAGKYKGAWDGLRTQLGEIVTLGVEAGKSVEDIVSVVNEARAAYAQPIALDALRAAEQRRAEEIKRGINSINALRAQGYINEQTSIEELTRLDIASIDSRRAALASEIAVMSRRKDSEREVSALRGQISTLDAQRETARLKGIQDVTTAIDKQKKAIEALYEAQRQQARDEIDAAYVADSQSRERARVSIDDYVRGLKQESELLAAEVRTLGMTRAERDLVIERMRIELDLKKRIQDIDRNLSFDEAQREEERNRLKNAAALSAQNALTRAQLAQLDDQISAIDSTAHRVWTDFGDDAATAAQRAGRAIKSAVWDMLYQLTVRKWVINVAANVLGVPGGNVLNAASGGGNLLNAAGTAANAYGMVSGASSLSLLTANATGAMGGDALGSLIASNSGNWGVSAAGTSSFASSLSAAGPYVAAAAILYSIAKSLDDSGTVHTGASSQYSASGGLATGMGVYGVGSKAGSYGVATEEMTTQVTKSIVGILDSTASTFGKQAGYAAAAGFADDTSKDGAWGALTIKLGDKIVEGFGQDGNGRWPGMSFADGQTGTQEYLAAVSADVRNALEQIGLPGWAEGMLDKLGEAPSLDQLAETVAVINATQSALVSLGQAMPQLAGLTDDATTALLASFDGIQGLSAAAQTYYEAFYSAGERSAATISQIGNTLTGLGLSMPATRDQYRALVEAQDLNTESGRKAYATLLQLSGSFASVVAAADEAGASVDTLAEQMAEAGQRMLSRLGEQTQALQIELLTAQGDTIAAAALRRQTDLAGLTSGTSASDAAAAAAIYDYNNALRQQIDTLEAAAAQQKAEAAQQKAEADRLKAVAAERYDLEGRILSLEGNTGALRDRQLSVLDSTNRALLEQIFALEDQQSQAQSAAAALQGVNSALSGLAGTRVNLQAELLTLQGDTAGAARIRREAELANLTAGMSAQDAARIAAAYDLNTALQQQIDETRSAQQAAEAMAQAQARAADEAQRASEQVTRAWQGVTDSIYDEVARIRGLVDGNSPASLAAAQTQFTLTNARASAGDQEAAKLLPALSRTLIDLATAQATTLAEVERVRAATAASLEQTGSLLSSRYGLSIPKLATGTNYVPRDMLAMLHEGESVTPKAYNPAAGASDSTAAELRQLRAQVETLTALLARATGATEKTRDLLNSVTEGGRAMQTEAAT